MFYGKEVSYGFYNAPLGVIQRTATDILPYGKGTKAVGSSYILDMGYDATKNYTDCVLEVISYGGDELELNWIDIVNHPSSGIPVNERSLTAEDIEGAPENMYHPENTYVRSLGTYLDFGYSYYYKDGKRYLVNGGVSGTIHQPKTIKVTFEDEDKTTRYYYWSGSSWYVAEKEGDKWEQVRTY